MTTRPLKLLLVSSDRSLLRHLSKFLGAFRYQVLEVADHELVAPALACGSCDVLIVDADPNHQDALEVCRRAAEHSSGGYVYTLLLAQDPSAADLVDALEAGVEDVLTKPIVYGELLVRLRAGARVHEFERRLRAQRDIQPIPGVLSGPAFRERLRRALSAQTAQPPTGTCSVVDLDFSQRVNRTFGRAAGEAVIHALADKLGAVCTPPSLFGHLGGTRFIFWLDGLSEDEAYDWAEGVRQDLATTSFPVAEQQLRFTASLGVAGQGPSLLDAEQLVQRALAALESAKTAGRNCVVRFTRFNDQAQAWEDDAAPGTAFERTFARDVMTPCTVVLTAEQTIGQAASLFRRTCLAFMPVVDANGTLSGVVSQEDVCAPAAEHGDRLSAAVSGVMGTPPVAFEEDCEFSELMEFFKRSEDSLAIVVHSGWPTGFVTSQSLASMSEPLDTGKFAPYAPCSHGSAYLMVQDPCAVGGPWRTPTAHDRLPTTTVK